MKHRPYTAAYGQSKNRDPRVGLSVDPGEQFRPTGPGSFVELDHGGSNPIQDYFEALLRRKWLMLGVFIFPIVCAVVYLTNAAPVFTSVATIELEEKTVKNNERLYGNTEYGQYRTYLLTQLEVLKSRSLAEALVTKMQLAESPEFAQERPRVLGWILGLPSTVWSLFSPPVSLQDSISQPEARMNALASAVLGRVSVKIVKTSNLVSVSMIASKPDIARDMLQAYLALYLELALENRRRESVEAAKWLKTEVETAQRKSLESQAALVEFVVDNGIVAGPEGGLGHVMNLMNRSMDGRLKSHEGRLRIQALKDQNNGGEGSGLPKNMDTEYVGKLKEQLAIHETEYTQQKGIYSPNYPKMKSLSQKIAFLRQRITEIERSVVNSALETAKKEEGLFAQSFDKVKNEADRVKGLQAQYALYTKAVETDQEFHKILLREYKEQEIKSRTIANDVRLVDPPSVPGQASWPNKKKVMLLACCLGLIGAIAAAFIAERLDQSVYYPVEIERDFHLPRLGVIPDSTRLPSSSRQTGSGSELPEFLARTEPQSPVADAVRNLQASIMLGSAYSKPQCIAISSANPQQGKTLIAVSVGTVLSSKREKTVIVDGDLRRPRLHEVFGLSKPTLGLSDFLASDKVQVEDVLRYSKIPGVSYVTSGGTPADPVELLQSDRLAQLVEQLRTLFDHVVFDCPPMLGFPDAHLVALHTDGLIMVAKQGGVGRDELREAIRVFSAANACPLLGVVLNQARFPGRFGYRYGGYYYGYHRNYYRKA